MPGFNGPIPRQAACFSVRTAWLAVLFGLASFLAGGPQAAQTADAESPQRQSDLTELSIEQLMNVEVYSASKFLQKISEAPSSVSIITSDDIRKYGYRTLAEVLRSVRGLYVTYDRNYSYLGVRGFNRPGDTNSRVLMLVDGHRITENLYDSSYLGTDFILDADLIDRVEVVRGPGSSLYGSNAFFAVIDVITKKASDIAGTEVSAEADSLRSLKARLSYGGRLASGAELVLSASGYESDGNRELYFKEFDTPANNNGIARNADHDRSSSLFSRLAVGDLVLSGAYVSRTKEIPTASYETLFNDNRSRTTDAQGYLDLLFSHSYASETEVQARINYNRYEYDGWYVYDATVTPGPAAASINRDDVLGEWIDAEALVRKTLWMRHKFTLGAEYRHNTKQNIRNYDEDAGFSNTDVRNSSETVGFFLQTESALHDKLLLNAGLRHDRYSTFGGTTNPRLALIYRPSEKSTIKAIYGRAFRAPNVWETSLTDPVSKGNPHLQPETIRNYELVYEQRLKSTMLLIVNSYYSNIHGLISQELDPADDMLVNLNLGSVTSRGVEFELEGHAPSGTNWRISYSLQRSKDEDTGQELDNSPQQLGKAVLSIPAYADKVYAGLELQYHGSVRTLSGNREDSFWLANASLFSRKLLPTLELSAGIHNLFDTRYGHPGATQHVQDTIEQDGRTYRVKLTAIF